MRPIALTAVALAVLFAAVVFIAQAGTPRAVAAPPAPTAPKAAPAAPKVVPTEAQKNAAEEISCAEEIVSSREKYQKQLEKLADLYLRTGNEFKARMVLEELDSLKNVRRHNYIIVAEAMGAGLKPMKTIPEAEHLYTVARGLDNLNDPTAPGENKRKALDLYNELICRYPESSRISEAAFHAAEIYENVVGDFYSAVIYYQRSYQWDPVTSLPARIQAARVAYARILDYRMAKKLYEAALENVTPAQRAEASAMVDLLKAWGY